ncbi:MAG: four-carbon acid sugar kinase family protein, partial [Bryobacteraceae bacterium]
LDAGGRWPADRPALVVDLASRHLPEPLAAQTVREAASQACRLGARYVYLKTDSTLRGPIGGPMQALLDVFPERPLVYAPAYPAMARTVIEGVLFVEGRPLAESAFAQDPLEPARESSVLRVIARDCHAPVRLVRSAAELGELLAGEARQCVLVCDGREDADLRAVAAVVAVQPPPQIAAGPGGFVGAWVRALPLARNYSPQRPRPRRWLVVNGSLHPRSREQAARADVAAVLPGGTYPSGHEWALVQTPEQPSPDAFQVASDLARCVARAVRENGVEGLVIFGGDTARAVLEALDVRVLEPLGEALPGVPVSRVRELGLTVISKAGGFGPPDVVARIRTEVERWQ